MLPAKIFLGGIYVNLLSEQTYRRYWLQQKKNEAVSLHTNVRSFLFILNVYKKGLSIFVTSIINIPFAARHVPRRKVEERYEGIHVKLLSSLILIEKPLISCSSAFSNVNLRNFFTPLFPPRKAVHPAITRRTHR